MSTTQTTKSAFPFFSILALIFITLKLCAVINWSWWLVLAPIWGPVAAVVVIFLIVGIIYALKS